MEPTQNRKVNHAPRISVASLAPESIPYVLLLKSNLQALIAHAASKQRPSAVAPKAT